MRDLRSLKFDMNDYTAYMHTHPHQKSQLYKIWQRTFPAKGRANTKALREQSILPWSGTVWQNTVWLRWHVGLRDGQEPDHSVLWSPRKEATFHSMCNRKPWMPLLRTDMICAPSPYLNNSNN